MLANPCHAFEPPPLSRARVALVTTGGVQRRSDPALELKTAEYRVIPRDTSPADIVMSHASTNFDRTGFQEAPNVVFPLQRCRASNQ